MEEMSTMIMPKNKTTLGRLRILRPNMVTIFSIKLDLDNADVEKFHFFKWITAGRKVEDNIQAQIIPKPIESP